MNLSSEHGNDIEALLLRLGKDPLHYVDVQSREAGRIALAKWPLLTKLRLAASADNTLPAIPGLPDSTA